MLIQFFDQHRLRYSSNNRINELAVFEQQQARNRADVELHRYLRIRINVHFADFDSTFVLLGELCHDRRDDLTWSAPRRPEIQPGPAPDEIRCGGVVVLFRQLE